MADLDEYERTLPSDCVNERCWVILQRVDFTRRSNINYNGQQVLNWMQEIVNIYRDRGQLSKEVEAEINIVKQYEEMIHLHQLKQDMETLSKMNEVLTDAYSKADRLPAMILGPLLIELAYLSTFSTVLKNPSQAKKAWDRFCGSGQSVNHFSKEVQEKADRLRRMFMAGCGDHQ
jgi:hypothetical protein